MPTEVTRLRANGDAIQALRALSGMTVSQLAMRAAVSRPYLSNIEQGRRPFPSPAVLARIADTLGVTHAAIVSVETTKVRAA